MDLNPKLVRHAGFFVIASSFMYKIIRNAKMYEVRRMRPSDEPSHLQSLMVTTETTLTRRRLKISLDQHPLRSIRRSRSNLVSKDKEDDTIDIVESKSNLPKCENFIKLYYRLVSSFHILLACKYLVLCMIDMGTLAPKDYGYLDCLLAGRTTLSPRVVGLCKYASMCVFCFHSLHHIVLLNRKSPFKIHCMEFLLVSPRTIEEFSQSSELTCSLLSYRSLKTSSIGSAHLRPNRTVRAWRRLATFTTLWVGSVVGTYALAIPIIWLYVLPMIVTQTGFEINYHHCLSWIAQQEDNSTWRRLIYQVPENYTGPDPRWRQEYSVPMSEPWVEMSAYHTVRILLEITENFIGQMQVWIGYSVFTLIAILMSLDTYYYCRRIEDEIVAIIREQRDEPAVAMSAVEQGPLARSKLELNKRAHQRLQRIDNAQAMVLDMFGLIRDYNPYTVHYVCFGITVWYMYSFICSSWLFMPYDEHQASTVESQLIQVAATVLILVILGSYAGAQVACRHLYKSIATIVTLPEIETVSRKRWLVILQHYTPVPLYCFSLFRTSELSWMFALKLSAWLFSALLILSSFTSGGSRLWSID